MDEVDETAPRFFGAIDTSVSVPSKATPLLLFFGSNDTGMKLV
jgi:hypothetical protein